MKRGRKWRLSFSTPCVNGTIWKMEIPLSFPGWVRTIVLSAPLAWYGVTKWLEGFAYKTPLYLWVFVAALFVVMVITLATVIFQSWKAATANPVESIKNDNWIYPCMWNCSYRCLSLIEKVGIGCRTDACPCLNLVQACQEVNHLCNGIFWRGCHRFLGENEITFRIKSYLWSNLNLIDHDQ